MLKLWRKTGDTIETHTTSSMHQIDLNHFQANGWLMGEPPVENDKESETGSHEIATGSDLGKAPLDPPAILSEEDEDLLQSQSWQTLKAISLELEIEKPDKVEWRDFARTNWEWYKTSLTEQGE